MLNNPFIDSCGFSLKKVALYRFSVSVIVQPHQERVLSSWYFMPANLSACRRRFHPCRTSKCCRHYAVHVIFSKNKPDFRSFLSFEKAWLRHDRYLDSFVVVLAGDLLFREQCWSKEIVKNGVSIGIDKIWSSPSIMREKNTLNIFPIQKRKYFNCYLVYYHRPTAEWPQWADLPSIYRCNYRILEG